MSNTIYAEISKLIHKKAFWIIHILLFLFIEYSFFGKAYDLHTGIYQPELVTSNYIILFNLKIISIFSSFYATIIFGLSAANDIETNCISYILLNQNRLYYNFYKIVSCTIIVLLNSVFYIMIGYIQCVLYNGEIYRVSMLGILTALSSNILLCLFYGISSYLLCFIVKSASTGIFVIIIFNVLNGFFESKFKIVEIINRYTNNIARMGFDVFNSSNDKQIRLIVNRQIHNYSNSILLIMVYIVIVFLLIEIISKYRNYNV